MLPRYHLCFAPANWTDSATLLQITAVQPAVTSNSRATSAAQDLRSSQHMVPLSVGFARLLFPFTIVVPMISNNMITAFAGIVNN